jgi:hypothetical protein
MDPFQLSKHKKYRSAYKSFDLYWGLGVEHELYLKTTQKKDITSFEGNMKPERYSVDYLKIYKPEPFHKALADYLKIHGGKIQVPVLVNSHSFTHCDMFNSHKMTYEKVPKPNPNYSGKSFWDWISEKSQWLREHYDSTFMWDGDTLEIITVDFYKASVKSVITELRRTSSILETEISKLPRQGLLAGYGPLTLAIPRNEPFAVYLTNLKNVAMFNNGTIHINLTLPTRLGLRGIRPMFWNKFVRQHQRLARFIQWLEPALIAVYNSGDPLSRVSDRYATGSQRVAVSRYIGLGVYDTEKMEAGKILQVPRDHYGALPWYDWLYSHCDYNKLEKIGLDLNFNKHGAHGLELRFFDQMAYDKLEKVMRGLVLVMDSSLKIKKAPNPRMCKSWQIAAGEALLYGQGWCLSVEQQADIYNAFQIHIDPKEPMYVIDWLQGFFKTLEQYRGKCWKMMCAE